MRARGGELHRHDDELAILRIVVARSQMLLGARQALRDVDGDEREQNENCRDDIHQIALVGSRHGVENLERERVDTGRAIGSTMSRFTVCLP